MEKLSNQVPVSEKLPLDIVTKKQQLTIENDQEARELVIEIDRKFGHLSEK